MRPVAAGAGNPAEQIAIDRRLLVNRSGIALAGKDTADDRVTGAVALNMARQVGASVGTAVLNTPPPPAPTCACTEMVQELR